MEITQEDKKVSLIGDIKTNAISIDENNVNFIVSMLSANFYSKPIESFIRETVSNAWDSHTEAGVSDPIILEMFADAEQQYFCKVQDFGVGLSPERFDNIYRKIGSSTKRESNALIGGFGFGRFSGLSYSNIIYITSIYDNVEYKYIMYKDGNSTSIDLINTSETEKRNSVEVKIPVKKEDLSNFVAAIKTQLVYFENIFLIDNTDYFPIKDFDKDFNDIKIKKYNTFYVNTTDYNKLDIVLGKVKYPLDSLAFPRNLNINFLHQLPISLKFEIGDLDVTPNREQILYSDKSVAKITEKLEVCKKEIIDLFHVQSKKDYTNISDFVEAIDRGNYLELLQDKKVKIDDESLNITLNGKEYSLSSFRHIYRIIFSEYLIPIKGEVKDGIVKKCSYSHSLEKLKNNFSSYYVCDINSANTMTKHYLKHLGKGKTIYLIPPPSSLQIKQSIISLRKKFSKFSIFDYEYFREILEYFLKNLSKIPLITNENIPQDFITRKKLELKAQRALSKNNNKIDWSENINIGILRNSQKYHIDIVSSTETLSLKELKLKYRKKIIIFSEKNNEKLRLFFKLFLAGDRNYLGLEIAPTKMKLIENINNFINLKDFMINKDYKLLRNIATAKYIQEKIPFIHELASMKNLSLINASLYIDIKKLSVFTTKYLDVANRYKNGKKESSLVEEICGICSKVNLYNFEMKGLLDSNFNVLLKCKFIIDFGEKVYSKLELPENRINIIVDYILARKLFRPDISAIYRLKKNNKHK